MALRCSERLKNTITLSKLNNDNQGFSIVEVLIGVFVLAIVFTPVMKSFMVASITNSKAQKIQNATSLAESIMEEVKGKSIEELHKEAVSGSNAGSIKFLSAGQTDESSTFEKKPPYTITYSGFTATQGRTYDAEVVISRSEYAQTSSDDASDANTKELPKLGKINSERHAVLSWEINQHDGLVLDKLVDENKSDTWSVSAADISQNGNKNINILIANASGRIKITCEIEYTTGNSTDKTLKYLVYTGYFDNLDTEINGGPNIYLFYTTSEKYSPSEYFKNENITITDNSSSGRHNVYFIMQDGVDRLSTSNTNISLNVSGSAWTQNVSLSATSAITDNNFILSKGADDIEKTPDDVELCTNLWVSDAEGGKQGDLFNKEAKDRIYYVTVNIKDHGKSDILTNLTSTMETGSEADKH